jgi:hypothetical protein
LAVVVRILKARWQEATLVILLQAGLIVLLEEIAGRTALSQQVQSEALPGHVDFIVGMGTTIFAIVWQMLYLGFLATAYSEGASPKQPAQLVSVGRLFFWRMLRFQIILGIVYIGISFMLLAIVQSMVFGQKDVLSIPDWIAQLCSFATLAILVKPILLTPAVMIVKDCMVLQALGSLREYKILEARVLLRAFFICFATVYLLSSWLGVIETGDLFYYVMVGTYAIISSTLILAITLAAVLFVGSKTIPATEPTENNLTAD